MLATCDKIASIANCVVANGVYQNSLYGVAAQLPMKYANAVITGTVRHHQFDCKACTVLYRILFYSDVFTMAKIAKTIVRFNAESQKYIVSGKKVPLYFRL